MIYSQTINRIGQIRLCSVSKGDKQGVVEIKLIKLVK